MPLGNSLAIPLLISMIVHTVIFLPLPYFKTPFDKKDLPVLKITYLPPVKVSLKETHLQLKKKPITKDMQQASEKDVTAKFKMDKGYKPKDESVKKTVGVPEPKSSQGSQIEIPPELPKGKEELYINYYQSIREKIRRFVVKNYPRFIDCGEVCLYFVLSSNGRLKEIDIVEERSTQNHLLKEIAKKSLRQASPFLSFPKGLSSSQLSFNVIISFELLD